MKMRLLAWGLALLSPVLVTCGQEDVVLPDMGGGASAGECGGWYPGGGGDAGAGDEFGIEEGKILPCLVWESAQCSISATIGAPCVPMRRALSALGSRRM